MTKIKCECCGDLGILDNNLCVDCAVFNRKAKKEVFDDFDKRSEEYLQFLNQLHKEQKTVDKSNIVSTAHHSFKNIFKAFSKTKKSSNL